MISQGPTAPQHQPRWGLQHVEDPVPVSAKAVTHVPGLCKPPEPHPAELRTWLERDSPQAASCAGVRNAGPWAAAPALGSGRALPALAPAMPRGGRFTGCQSQGQRSAGVRKSISERSLSTSFNLMKPLFVKAAALPAIPLKPSRAQRLALKEQEGVPFPFAFAIQQAPKTNTPHTEI